MTEKERKEVMLERIVRRLKGEAIFLAGDTVRVVDTDLLPRFEKNLGDIAKIVIITNQQHYKYPNLYTVGVRFENYCKGLHNLAGHCDEGHGWWLPTRALEIIKRVEEESDGG